MTDTVLAQLAALEGSAVAMVDDNKLLVLDIYRPTERYVQPVLTRGPGDVGIDGIIAIQYGPRILPVVQDDSVASIDTKASPAEA